MTYSIVARCPRTGEIGVGVQSHFFAVGAIVSWAEPGIGAVATQAMAEVSHGPGVLERLRAGDAADAALAGALAADPHAAARQVGVVDSSGRTAAHTGSSCIADAGHVIGDGYAAQANMMAAPGVPQAMADAFASTDGPLWARIADALDAAEAAGGDIRGRQSAAILVASGDPAERPGHGILVDVRVDDHEDPLREVRRLAELSVAYARIDEAEQLLAQDRPEQAVAIYDQLLAAHPSNTEFAFWAAVALAGAGRPQEARRLADPVLGSDDGDRWRALLGRLPPAGLTSQDVVDELLR